MAISQGDGGGGGRTNQGRTPGRTTKDRNPMVAYVPPIKKGGGSLPAWAVPNNFMGNPNGTPTAYVPPLPDDRSIPAYNDPANFNITNSKTVKPIVRGTPLDEIKKRLAELGMPAGMGNEMPVPDFMQYDNAANAEDEQPEQTGEVGGQSKEEWNMAPDPSTLIPQPTAEYMMPVTGDDEQGNGGFATTYTNWRRGRGGYSGGYGGGSGYSYIPAWLQALTSWNFRD